MPYARRRKKTYRPRNKTTSSATRSRTRSVRRVSSRRRYSKASTNVSLWKNPIPQKGYFKFVYLAQGFAFATTIANGYVALRVFRGNSLYDPDYTGAGYQPYGYDNYCGANCPFGKYTVYGSKITVYPHIYTTGAPPQNTSGSSAVRLIVFPFTDPTTAYSSYSDVCQIPRHRARCIENADDAGGNNILKSYCSTKFLYPNSPGLQDEGFSALYNANPVNGWFWQVIMDSTLYTNDITGYFDIKIVYYTKLTKYQNVNES